MCCLFVPLGKRNLEDCSILGETPSKSDWTGWSDWTMDGPVARLPGQDGQMIKSQQRQTGLKGPI